MNIEELKFSPMLIRLGPLMIEGLHLAIAPLFGVTWSRGEVKNRLWWLEAAPRLN